VYFFSPSGHPVVVYRGGFSGHSQVEAFTLGATTPPVSWVKASIVSLDFFTRNGFGSI